MNKICLCSECTKWDTAERVDGIDLPFYHCKEDDGKHYNTRSCNKFVPISKNPDQVTK